MAGVLEALQAVNGFLPNVIAQLVAGQYVSSDDQDQVLDWLRENRFHLFWQINQFVEQISEQVPPP
jgi:hypothetical protein